LGPAEGDGSQGAAVDEVLLVGSVESHDGEGGFVDAAVFVVGVDVVPPRLDAAGDAGVHPELDFRGRFSGEAELGRAAVLVLGHGFGDDFVPAGQGMDEVAIDDIFDDAVGDGAGLFVEEDDLGAGEDFFGVAECVSLGGDVGGLHAQPEAVYAAGGLRDFVVEVPLFEAAGVGPFDPFAEGGVVPVAGGGEGSVGERLEAAGAVLTVADRVTVGGGPGVVGEAFGMVAVDDFAHDVGKELVVVGAVDAGDVELAGHVRLAIGVDGDVVGVGVEKGAVDFGGIHAGDDGEAVVVGGFGEIA